MTSIITFEQPIDAAQSSEPLSSQQTPSADMPAHGVCGLSGSTGHAKIHAGYQPLYRRLWRTACRTFHFQM
ncbi:MAG: hypothetical protein K8R36_17505, partial [Planctomycetales bacterium]|nr:hypothetical protein [Planctomycetales bacterium]